MIRARGLHSWLNTAEDEERRKPAILVRRAMIKGTYYWPPKKDARRCGPLFLPPRPERRSCTEGEVAYTNRVAEHEVASQIAGRSWHVDEAALDASSPVIIRSSVPTLTVDTQL